VGQRQHRVIAQQHPGGVPPGRRVRRPGRSRDASRAPEEPPTRGRGAFPAGRQKRSV
jgi:hypothetical protein